MSYNAPRTRKPEAPTPSLWGPHGIASPHVVHPEVQVKTVERMTAECELMNNHARFENGKYLGCPGRCLGNDKSTAMGAFAGEQVRVKCNCPCHAKLEAELRK